jgi:DNA-binding HxlR family transcriptional regulator
MAKKVLTCAVEGTLGVIGGRWKVLIVYFLLDGAKRFNELKRHLPGITQRTLTRQLRELERDGLVERLDFKEKPLRVEYRLTPLGRSLKRVLLSMHDWFETRLARRPEPEAASLRRPA